MAICGDLLITDTRGVAGPMSIREGRVFFFRGTRVVSYDLQLSHFVG